MLAGGIRIYVAQHNEHFEDRHQSGAESSILILFFQAQQGASLNLTRRIAAELTDNITLLMHNGDIRCKCPLCQASTVSPIKPPSIEILNLCL